MIARIFAAGVSLAMGACSLASQSATDTPALITSTDAPSRAALRAAVTAATGKDAMLADDALTKESSIVIDRTAARDSGGRRIEARETSAPQVLHLIKRGDDCILVLQATKKETKIEGVSCVAASAVNQH